MRFLWHFRHHILVELPA
jgi:hypothetical protein